MAVQKKSYKQKKSDYEPVRRSVEKQNKPQRRDKREWPNDYSLSVG